MQSYLDQTNDLFLRPNSRYASLPKPAPPSAASLVLSQKKIPFRSFLSPPFGSQLSPTLCPPLSHPIVPSGRHISLIPGVVSKQIKTLLSGGRGWVYAAQCIFELENYNLTIYRLLKFFIIIPWYSKLYEHNFWTLF